MPVFGPINSAGAVGRLAFGAATVAAALLGAMLADARLLAAAGAFGTIWWAWDLLAANVLAPMGRLLTGAVTGTSGVEEPPDLTVDDTIRLLESHLAGDAAPRHVQIQSALRLAEMYRWNRKDEAKAEEVLAKVRAKWPDAPEFKVRGEE